MIPQSSFILRESSKHDVGHIDASVVFYDGIAGRHTDSFCDSLRRKVIVADNGVNAFYTQNVGGIVGT